MSATLGVALPFWLDRPDDEAIGIALAAEQAGIDTVWVGEMATFDAFALATDTRIGVCDLGRRPITLIGGSDVEHRRSRQQLHLDVE